MNSITLFLTCQTWHQSNPDDSLNLCCLCTRDTWTCLGNTQSLFLNKQLLNTFLNNQYSIDPKQTIQKTKPWGFFPTFVPRELSCCPRNYPIRFGWKLLQLRDLMLSDHSQPPSKRWDADLDSMEAALKRLNWGHTWEEGGIKTVCRYLYGSTELKLPQDIKNLIPKSF